MHKNYGRQIKRDFKVMLEKCQQDNYEPQRRKDG